MSIANCKSLNLTLGGKLSRQRHPIAEKETVV